jgi:lipid-binding SYLF domain-containing protein
MSLSERVKSRFIVPAIIALIAAASSAVFADQEAEDELSAIEPPLSCLGLGPCDAPQGNEVQQRYRGASADRSTRAIGSEEAERVLEQVYALPEADKRFLYDKLSVARGFAIFPEVRKSGVMAASVYGKGIMSFRDQSWEWSPPILLHMQGASVGPQVCAQCSRIIFIFDRICDVRDFLQGQHRLVTTGPSTSMEHVGHPAPPELGGIKIYTVSNGVMMGQSLQSYSIHIDEEGNAALYGVDFKPGCIVEGRHVGLQAPFFLKFMQNMQLPPGQPHSTTTVK